MSSCGVELASLWCLVSTRDTEVAAYLRPRHHVESNDEEAVRLSDVARQLSIVTMRCACC